MLKTEGRQDDSIAAYRRAIALQPSFGEAYWSLANLKTFRFSAATTSPRCGRSSGPRRSARRIAYTCISRSGKALEDAGDSAVPSATTRWQRAAPGTPWPTTPPRTTRVLRHQAACSRATSSRAREGDGDPSASPIFIVGMPRAGSTLIEQILSSHSAGRRHHRAARVDHDGRELRRCGLRGYRVPMRMCSRPAAELRSGSSGSDTWSAPACIAKLDRPLFIDKMPNNFLHVGMIHLALPNAKIIDARRHPMACCFSNFKQHFARGQNFSYAWRTWAAIYRDYVDLMAHFDTVLPGRIHRVFYERMVDDTEAEIRRAAGVLRPAVRARVPAIFTRTSARCAPPAPSRSASRSSATASSSGDTSSAGLTPSSRRSVRP